MRKCVISIQKVLTIVTPTKVITEELSKFEEVISKFEEITAEGILKPAKRKKYELILKKSGFVKVKKYWDRNAGFEGANSDVTTFSIEYKKRK